MKKYKTGDVSRIVNMPVETIRFFEREGLISPERKEGSSYRIYGATDIEQIMNYRWYRHVGFTAQDSILMTKNGSPDQHIEKMHDAQQEAEKQLHYYELKAQRLQQYNETLISIFSLCSQCAMSIRPEMFCCANLHRYGAEAHFKFAKELGGCFEEHVEYLTFMDSIFCIRKENFCENPPKNEVLWGFGLEMKWIELLKIQTYPKMEHIPPVPSVYTIIRLKKNDSLKEKLQSILLPYLKKHAYVLDGDVWGTLIVTMLEGHEEVQYLNAWAPIR